MRVTQYRIKGYTWSECDKVCIDIRCEKVDLNNILNRMRAKNKNLLRSITIKTCLNEAQISFLGMAKLWQEIEDLFPCLADSSDNDHDSIRTIHDPSLIIERKNKNIQIFNGRQYSYNRYLGIMEVCLN